MLEAAHLQKSYGARKVVRLETYIFHEDAAGESVLSALERAARRGVAVHLAIDGIGTPSIPAQWQERLQRSGAQWQHFSPLGSFGLLIPGRWRRLHRKLCVVDGEVAFCGGINILDDYLGVTTKIITVNRQARQMECVCGRGGAV